MQRNLYEISFEIESGKSIKYFYFSELQSLKNGIEHIKISNDINPLLILIQCQYKYLNNCDKISQYINSTMQSSNIVSFPTY